MCVVARFCGNPNEISYQKANIKCLKKEIIILIDPKSTAASLKSLISKTTGIPENELLLSISRVSTMILKDKDLILPSMEHPPSRFSMTTPIHGDAVLFYCDKKSVFKLDSKL